MIYKKVKQQWDLRIMQEKGEVRKTDIWDIQQREATEIISEREAVNRIQINGTH